MQATDTFTSPKVTATELMKNEDAAAYLGLSEKTLNTDRCTRAIGIPFVKMGRSVRYRLSDLEKFVADRVVA